jgi:hypothetical protein
MDEKLRQKIEPIKMQMKCPDSSSWINNENKQICKARAVGLDTYIECLEDERYHECTYNRPYSSIYLCECPARIFVAKKLGR